MIFDLWYILKYTIFISKNEKKSIIPCIISLYTMWTFFDTSNLEMFNRTNCLPFLCLLIWCESKNREIIRLSYCNYCLCWRLYFLRNVTSWHCHKCHARYVMRKSDLEIVDLFTWENLEQFVCCFLNLLYLWFFESNNLRDPTLW